MSDQNGITQSPFSEAWPTPDVSGTGVSGIGGGLDMGAGANGIMNSPWTNPVCPVPGGSPTADGLESGKTASTFPLDGSGSQGQNAPWDITSSRNTVDKR
jgi:hypothetical protein